MYFFLYQQWETTRKTKQKKKITITSITYRFNEVHLLVVCLSLSPLIVIWIPVPTSNETRITSLQLSNIQLHKS